MHTHVYIYMCISIIPTKWAITRLEIISNLSSLSFMTSSSFPFSALVQELCPGGWERTGQGEGSLGGRKRPRMGTAWSTGQHLLAGTRKESVLAINAAKPIHLLVLAHKAEPPKRSLLLLLVPLPSQHPNADGHPSRRRNNQEIGAPETVTLRTDPPTRERSSGKHQ